MGKDEKTHLNVVVIVRIIITAGSFIELLANLSSRGTCIPLDTDPRLDSC